ncbi:MBL fold metallo-hydrolase [Pararhizobium mangrovi]|uniref:MBL fold metallo-hydrolase n=1 Tax=Pararhizobium mangrovi TaxID=2590452 RepID=A0A506UAV0_9HYPH|nr:MBL fold metallo-hydrolase [Pararhizobium mangrovi]TPW30648.1 MBL fold metallo-hydrolase [Pararhizobium mangrovi]
MPEPSFQTAFDPQYGHPVPVAEAIARLTAPNAGPMTFKGTNTYLVGSRALAVVDPGPEDERHWDALKAAIAGRPVSHVLATHTHRDHSPLARRLAEETGAVLAGIGPHRLARPLHDGELNRLAEAADTSFVPDRTLADGEVIEGDGWRLETVHTPGHAANHAAYALAGTGILLCGDHVMAWATPVVAPPDGSMRDYMASLDRLLARDDTLYLPGHGGPIEAPHTFVRALRAHRRMRERSVLNRVKAGDRTIGEMVAVIYQNADRALHGAAALNVFAHLEDLVARGSVTTDGAPTLDGRYVPA